MMKSMLRFVASILALAVALPASAQIYQWKDKEGKTHFSDMPPSNQSGTQVQTLKRTPATDTELDDSEENGAKPAAAAAPAQKKSQNEQLNEDFRKRRADAEAKEKAEKEAARTEQNCQRARAQYAALNSGQRVSLPTETGGRKFLNEEERALEIERTKELVDTFCGKS